MLIHKRLALPHKFIAPFQRQSKHTLMLTRVRDWATCRQHCVQSRSPCLHVLRCSNHQPITCARKRVWHRNKAKRKIVRKRCSPDDKRSKREHTAMQSGRVVGEMPHKKKTKKKGPSYHRRNAIL
ncbi:hypothetical protein TRVL_08730 [Trypanosoma vivax]|nr:hypothetical protein TRVL_08730 [Trypanosoma vivax]